MRRSVLGFILALMATAMLALTILETVDAFHGDMPVVAEMWGAQGAAWYVLLLILWDRRHGPDTRVYLRMRWRKE